MEKYLEEFSKTLDFNWPTDHSRPAGGTEEWNIKADRSTWPANNYIRRPSEEFNPQDHVIALKHLPGFYVDPGEFGYFVNGKDYLFESLSFVLTNTQPGGGPPLHMHETEEAHIITEGELLYYIEGEVFSAKGPFMLRIPSGVPHTFINIGSKPFHLVAAFPSNQLDITELGPNPLIKEQKRTIQDLNERTLFKQKFHSVVTRGLYSPDPGSEKVA